MLRPWLLDCGLWRSGGDGKEWVNGSESESESVVDSSIGPRFIRGWDVVFGKLQLTVSRGIIECKGSSKRDLLA